MQGIRIKVRVDKGSNELKNQSSLRKNNPSFISDSFYPFSFKSVIIQVTSKETSPVATEMDIDTPEPDGVDHRQMCRAVYQGPGTR